MTTSETNKDNLEVERATWYKYVNNVVMGSVLVRLSVNVICFSLIMHSTQNIYSSPDIIALMISLIDFVLVITFAIEKQHTKLHYWYLRFSLLTSSFIYYYSIDYGFMTIIILIINFILNLHFLWLLALRKINVFLTKDAKEWMYSADKKNTNDIPDRLQGIFYMDGNPANEDLLTFENGDWDKNNNILTLKNINNYNWSYENNKQGLKALKSAKCFGFNYKIYFDESLSNGGIDAYVYCCPIPKWLINLTFEEIENDNNNWKRRTITCGYYHSCPWYHNKVYIMRKIYDKDRNIIDHSFINNTTISTYSISTL